MKHGSLLCIGVCVYVKNHLKGSVIHVPDEDSKLEIVHLIIKQTTPVCNIFACYLDVERSDKDKTTTYIIPTGCPAMLLPFLFLEFLGFQRSPDKNFGQFLTCLSVLISKLSKIF